MSAHRGGGRRYRAAPWALLVVTVVGGLLATGCRDARKLTDEQVDAVRVGADDVLTTAESDFVARTDGANAEIREALIGFFDAFESADVGGMRASIGAVDDAVEAFTADLAAQSDDAIVTTYDPYVPAWGRVIEALEGMRAGVMAGDVAGIEASARLYDRSIGEITELDRIQVERLRPVLGDAQLRSLLQRQGVDPETFGLTGEPAA